LVLNKDTAKKIYAGMQEQKLMLVNFQPTCENMLGYIAQKLKQVLPNKLVLHHLLLRETSSSYAEWYAADNS
jgi:6-pyruvoyltetrahydropterin/6-carboxytetrahydropterin synthase